MKTNEEQQTQLEGKTLTVGSPQSEQPFENLDGKKNVHQKTSAKGRQFWARFLLAMNVIVERISAYFKRLFTCPLVKDPIYFDCGDAARAKLLSIGNIYDVATKELIESVFEERKDKIKGKMTEVQKIDLDRFPGWAKEEIVHLREQFKSRDVQKNGLNTFRDLCKTLDKIGNKRSEEERRIHFDAVDKDRSGFVDFEEFCTLVYNLVNADEELPSESVASLYKSLDREAALIRNLTVIQQLQSGLF